MGILEEIDKLELSDEEKDRLRSEYAADVDPLKSERDSLMAKDKRSSVEAEVKGLMALGFSEAPGLLKYYRRVLLSTDAEEPGAVLMSDAEMHLSGDTATGASGREEVSVAGALRKFVELLPRNNEGKLELSDMHLADDHGRQEEGGDEEGESSEDHKKNLERITGRSLTRTRKRYARGIVSGGGDE